MPYCLLPFLVFVSLFTACAQSVRSAETSKRDPDKVEFFEKRVRPLLADNCFACHGPDKHKGGLRLDSRAGLLTGGESGPAIVIGNPDSSRLIQAIRYDGDLHMPPRGKLADDHIAVLTAWIKMGAPWPKTTGHLRTTNANQGLAISAKDRAFWSYQPVRQPRVPARPDKSLAQTPIDAFILAGLEEQGLQPVAAADKRALLRRATFDLTGLPPTADELGAFLADPSAGAFARVVERLLASPHYGERWARHWLDVARYGEDQAHTFQARKYPDAFRYRDWVVKAFNQDMPYDRFVMEQIAGDLLDGPDRAERLAALGFFALGPVYYGKAVADELDDRLDTLSRGFLGLTVACARCHDHKFDPIPARDYYALAGVFASTDYKEYVLTSAGTIDDKAVSEPTDKAKKQGKSEPRKPVLHSLSEGAKIANLHVHLRGNPATLGEEAPRHFLSILAGDHPTLFTKGSGRLELAQAIANRKNPLTARVLVNRIWMHHFGRGIVATPSNLGAMGERPTHPELLDYLANQFMANGWSIKALHREIMLSAAYQRSSQYEPENARRDPDNRWLWRMSRRRLQVEAFRDGLLAVAGNLDFRIGGPALDLSSDNNFRRTLYGAVSRHNLDPLLRLFDFPDANLTNDRRAVTTVPLQQLFVLNSEFIIRQASALAARVTAGEQDQASRIRKAFLLTYGRSPSAREIELGERFLLTATPFSREPLESAFDPSSHAALARGSRLNDAGATTEAGQAGLSAWQEYAQVLLTANEFLFVD